MPLKQTNDHRHTTKKKMYLSVCMLSLINSSQFSQTNNISTHVTQNAAKNVFCLCISYRMQFKKYACNPLSLHQLWRVRQKNVYYFYVSYKVWYKVRYFYINYAECSSFTHFDEQFDCSFPTFKEISIATTTNASRSTYTSSFTLTSGWRLSLLMQYVLS